MSNPRLVLALIALCFAAATPLPAAAEKVFLPGDIHPVDPSIPSIDVGPTVMTAGTCTLGGPTTPYDEIDYFQPPDDEYYTLLDPGTCTQCTATKTLTVDAVHLSIYFRTLCTQPVMVSIVEAKDGPCPEPDLTKVLVPPTHFDLPGPGPGIFIFNLALPSPVCLRGKAFLGITVTQFGSGCEADGINTPTLVYGDTLQCQPCRYYNYYFDGTDFVRSQLCKPGGLLTPGPLVHYVTGTCCALVPVMPATWGQLKIRYGSPRRRRRRVARPRPTAT
jgi:hypothetical protein